MRNATTQIQTFMLYICLVLINRLNHFYKTVHIEQPLICQLQNL